MDEQVQPVLLAQPVQDIREESPDSSNTDEDVSYDRLEGEIQQ
jgi:hypothetical protein